jgi:hypothetical protein
MAFVLKRNDTYTWPVSFEIPVDGGIHEQQTFDIQFKRMPQKWIRDVLKKIDAEQITDGEIVREITVGWSGVMDSNNKELPFSQSALEEMLDVPTLASAIVVHYFRATSGAKEKN